MTRRTDLRIRRNDDRGVAGVVGFVLVLAAAVTYYSYAAQNEVPRVGAENERAWEAEVGAAFLRLASAAGQNAATGASAREVFPPAPEAPTQTIPLLAPLRSARAAASLAYAESCGGATFTHAAGAATVVDLASGAGGCLTFRGDTVYASPFAYRMENGGVLLIQGDKAAVMSGPPLDISTTHVSMTLLELRGTSQTLGVDRAEAPVSLTPRQGALELISSQNADATSWTLATNYPEAWDDWYDGRLAGSGTSTWSCDNAGTGPARAPCRVTVTLPGSTSLSLSYGRYDVDMG